MTESNIQNYEFQAEVSQLLQLLTHSIYSNKEVFLRELIANANDAIDKARLKSLTDTHYLGEDNKFKITVDVDKDNCIIKICDNGIGMTKEEIVENIGTIAKSGTKEFLNKLKENSNNNLIGQFGVGFYSVFMVAKKVDLESKSTEEDMSYIWSSNGEGSFSLQEGTKTNRGTEITIYLKDDEKEFADENTIKNLIKKYSNYIPVEILMLEKIDEKDESKERKYEVINQTTSIWTRNKNDISEDEYNEFYSSISYDYQAPLGHVHLNIEGMVSYKGILYIPGTKNMFLQDNNEMYGPKLYVKNILILENCKDLLPNWLRFVKGVIETADLPLNISREMLQDNKVLLKIKNTLTKHLINKLAEISNENKDKYLEFLNNYGNIIKEGVYFDFENREQIATLLRYHSLNKNEYIGIEEYIENMKEGQKEIYYLTGMDIDDMKSSPYLETFKDNGIDVLLMNEPIDEYVVNSLVKYKDMELISVTSDKIDFDKNDQEKNELEEKQKENLDFLEYVKNIIGEDKIEQVKLSNRLKDTIGVLVTKEGNPSAQMEKIMKAMNQYMPGNKRIFQLNDKNELVKGMIEEYKNNKDSEKLKDLILFSYDQALLNEGQGIENLQLFLNRLNKFAKSYLQ